MVGLRDRTYEEKLVELGIRTLEHRKKAPRSSPNLKNNQGYC